MNYNDLINALCALALTLGVSFSGYKAYNFVRTEVIKQSQKGLPSLEKFSQSLTQSR